LLIAAMMSGLFGGPIQNDRALTPSPFHKAQNGDLVRIAARARVLLGLGRIGKERLVSFHNLAKSTQGPTSDAGAIASRILWVRCHAVFMLHLSIRWIWRVEMPFLLAHIKWMTCSHRCRARWLDSKMVPMRTVNGFRQA